MRKKMKFSFVTLGVHVRLFSHFMFFPTYSKNTGLQLLNISNLQFSLFMPLFETFSILNAFHCAFLAFRFQVSKTQLFLLRLFVGFVDYKFKFCCEFCYLAYSAFFSDHKPGPLWSPNNGGLIFR